MEAPFTYLGMPVGGNPRRISFWEPVILKIKKRLSQWKQKYLSFGGRICLIRAVLSSIPLYFLSFFKMPQSVAARCNSILSRFLWGGVDGESKIAWVCWDRICKPKSCGGLAIKDWKFFNKALLGKWRWWMLRDKTSLWSRVLQSKYGNSVRSNDSNWWKDLHSTCFGVDQGAWFSEAVC